MNNEKIAKDIERIVLIRNGTFAIADVAAADNDDELANILYRAIKEMNLLKESREKKL